MNKVNQSCHSCKQHPTKYSLQPEKVDEKSSKGIGVTGCTIMRLQTDRLTDRRTYAMLIAISPSLSIGE